MASVIFFQVLSVAISAVSCSAGQSKGGVEESLSYWETFSASNIKRRIVKRDTRSQHPVEQLITFDSYGRKFSLLLRKDFSVLGSGFKIFVFEEDGKSHELHLDLNLYRGTVEGEVNSFVSAYWNDNQVLSASIQTASDLYVVEPAVNLIPNATNDTMIIYRESDLRWENNSRCGYVKDDGDEFDSVADQVLLNQTQNSRSKRGTCTNTEKNTCQLYLVADPTFVRNVGKDDLTETASRMLSVIDRVDQIYRQQQFDGCDAGFGFAVKIMHIFPKPTAGYPHTFDIKFTYYNFLETFSQDEILRDVCLGHIFTYQSFYDKGYVLGLAYTGSPTPLKRGGICSVQPVQRNTGWTSYLGNYPVPSLQALLVTTHELGHSWGSPHDSDTDESCNPPASNGGKYIMYPMSVAGRDRNNVVFSPCSKRSIGLVLNAKASCFIEEKRAFCGNYRIDPGEECDSGFIVLADGDKCCDSNCKLRPNARCSDVNTLCCKDCQMVTAAAGVTCFKTSDDICVLSSKCSGQSADCPASNPKPNGTRCFDKGKCNDGVCETLCAVHGFETCSCDTVEDACKRCCVDAKGSCFPLFTEGSYDYMLSGIACVSGICNEHGVCIQSSRNPVFRLWELLDLSSPSAFVKFMQNNIVWTIVILSLFFWVPISIVICYMDRKAKKEQDTLIHEVLDEMMDDQESVSTAVSAQSSSVPVGRHAKRRATHKEEIREAVRRMTLEMESSENPKTAGKVTTSMKKT